MRPRIRQKGTLGGVMRLKLPIIDERRGRILAHCKLVAHLLDLRCRAFRAASSRAVHCPS